MERLVFIYALFDPDKRRIRYIGKTTNPNKREKDHLRKKNGKTAKDIWVEALKTRGKKPIFKVIEVCEEDDWPARERYFIKKYRREKLLNSQTMGTIDNLGELNKIKQSLVNGEYFKLTDNTIVVKLEEGKFRIVYGKKDSRKSDLKNEQCYVFINGLRRNIPKKSVIYKLKIRDLEILHGGHTEFGQYFRDNSLDLKF